MRKKGKKKIDELKNYLRNLKKIYYYARQQKKIFLGYVISKVFLAGLGIVSPLLMAKELTFLTDGLLDQLLKVALMIFVLDILTSIGYYLSAKLDWKFILEILKSIQLDMAREMLRVETSEVDKKSSGFFIERMTKDSSNIVRDIPSITTDVTSIISSIGIMGAIFIISKIFFFYYLFYMVVIFILENKRTTKRNTIDKRYRKCSEATTGFIGELVRGIRDIKVLNAEASFKREMDDRITMMNNVQYEMDNVSRKYQLVSRCIKEVLSVVLVLLAIYSIKNNFISIANFIIIYMYKGKVLSLINNVAYFLESFKELNLSCNRVFEILDDTVIKKENFGTEHLAKVNGDFEFRNVYFGYDEKKMVLKGLNFKIKHNQTVSFVGKSGSGKSTIFNLLARLYPVLEGQILIDGHDIKNLDCDTIRGNISIITQNPYIFNMSIRQNLTIVKRDLTEDEMIEACKLACLHDYIMSLPDGYDTLVGEGGLTLSGGQKQRLAIARAFVQKTQIILFDEATSALDNETQENIQKAINNLKNHYTVLIIAHRLSTVIDSDQIFLVEDGQITASGTHEELVTNNKTYKNLYNKELKS